MELREMFKQMRSGDMKVHSELGTRDESKQTRNFGSRIQKMKTVTGINARAMVMKDVVIPFNPFTGVADDDYNRETPYRPILLVSQVIEGLKVVCAEDEELSKFWEKELGIKFSDGPATIEEYYAFKDRGYIKPRILSYSTVAMSFKGECGFPEFRVKYAVPPEELNSEGSYDPENAPIWHQAAGFFNSMLRPEADKKKQELEAAGQSKETIANERKTVFSKSPVGFVSPTNLIPFLFFPIDDMPAKLDPSHPQDLESQMRFYSFTDKWTVPLKEAMTRPMYDTDINFFDFHIKTPSSRDTKPSNGQVYTDDDSMELYTAMQIVCTDGRMALHGGKTYVNDQAQDNEQVFKNVFDTALAYFQYSQEQSAEDGQTFEKIMAASNKFRPISVVMPNFLQACNNVFTSRFANTEYFTDRIRAGHAAFLTAMNPANALAIADLDQEDIDEAEKQERQSVAELIQEQNVDSVTKDADILGVDHVNNIADLEL